MSLRKKTIVYICTIIAVQLAIISIVALVVHHLIFERLEIDFTKKGTENIRQMIDDDIHRLGLMAVDYQTWNAFYDYVGKPDERFEQENITPISMRDLDMDIVVACDDAGKIVISRAVDENGELTAVPRSVMELFAKDMPGNPARCPNPYHMGVASLPEGLLIYSIRPFLHNDQSGPPRGSGLIGRWMTQSLLDRYGKASGIPVHIYDGTPLKVKWGLFFETHSMMDAPNEIALSDNLAQIVMTFAGENGKPEFRLLATHPLIISHSSFLASWIIVGTLVLLAIGTCLITIRLLNRIILQRISSISEQVRDIAEKRDSSRQLSVDSNDELGLLTRDINTLLHQLNESDKDIRGKEAQLRLLIDKSPLAITICDKDGHLILANEQFHKVTGRKITDHPTLRQMMEIAMPDPEYRRLVLEKYGKDCQAAEKTGAPKPPLSYTGTTNFGHTVDLEVYIAEADGLMFRIINDVTMRNRTIRELEAASEAKSRFMANISHEIRTPLNGIVGMSQILWEANITGDQRECVNTIKESSDLLLTVINDILDISKIDAGKFTMVPEAIDLNVFMRSVNSLAGTSIEAKGLDFVCEIPTDLPHNIVCDSNRLKQVLLNLLNNAWKFTDHGFVALRLATRELSDGQYALRFEVADTGLGISQADQKRIFEPFVQVDTSSTRKYGGTGLGLAISKKLVQLMGGDIAIVSEPGKGSAFSFEIVVSKASRHEKTSRTTWKIDTDAGLAHPVRLLVAEDNLVNRKVIGMMLAKMSYKADFAMNGQQAAEMASTGKYDVILMDIQMPVMDGLEASVKIRRELPVDQQPRIIALTAHALGEDEKRCLAAGMDGHITKPVKAGVLQDALIGVWQKMHCHDNNSAGAESV
jgi:signal transduction histidine kinase/CheY-like chemotaxis protein/sensor domain CHASE-containing protein